MSVDSRNRLSPIYYCTRIFANSFASEGSGSAPRSSQRRVLVVDDNLDAAHSFASLVERIVGHRVDFAVNGYAALQLAEKIQPEIVFLDLIMPGIDGFELARRLKKAFGDSIRIIAVTASGTAGDREKSAKAGCDLHLVKPVPADVIERILA
jgi:CheY-like chemotaxis protein